MQSVLNVLAMLRNIAQRLGPYLALEILLPGGTLFALLLLLYRRRRTQQLSDGRVGLGEGIG